MAPNQYGDDDINDILEAETQQAQLEAAREAIGPLANPPQPALQPDQPARRPARS